MSEQSILGRLREGIFSIKRLNNGKFRFKGHIAEPWEECCFVDITREQLIQLADEIRQLAGEEKADDK